MFGGCKCLEEANVPSINRRSTSHLKRGKPTGRRDHWRDFKMDLRAPYLGARRVQNHTCRKRHREQQRRWSREGSEERPVKTIGGYRSESTRNHFARSEARELYSHRRAEAHRRSEELLHKAWRIVRERTGLAWQISRQNWRNLPIAGRVPMAAQKVSSQTRLKS